VSSFVCCVSAYDIRLISFVDQTRFISEVRLDARRVKAVLRGVSRLEDSSIREI
jgi:hypothetical protein